MIQHILICTAAIWGIHASTWYGMLWYTTTFYIEDNTPEWVGYWFGKPIYTCPICMASFWGSLYYTCFVFEPGHSVLHWLAFILPVAGISAIIVYLKSETDV